MIESPSRLIEQTTQRLVRQRQLNRLGVVFPVTAAIVWACWIILDIFPFPRLLIIAPIVVLAVWLWLVARRIRQSVEQELAAVLLDEKTDSQDRFLTFSTAPKTQTTSPLFQMLRRQIEEKAAAFQLDRDVPFTLDRRVLLSLAGSILCILALIFLQPLFSPTGGGSEAAVPTASEVQKAIEQLEEAARLLTREGTPPQEQALGKQLSTLAEKLKDPTLSQEEKQHLIEETQEKIKLSMPQLLPFDLKIFANDSKNDKGQGNQNDKPQKDGKSSGKSDKPTEQGKGTSSSGSLDQQQQGPQNNQQSDSKNQPQPKEGGGGIKFNQPQQQTGEKKERSGQEPGEQQQSAQNQAPNSQMPGSDPNRPGGQDSSQPDQQKPGQTPNPQQPGQGEGGKGSNISGGRGERFTQPGEQPGGFLTKDARFVKVRIPMGSEPRGKGDTLADNYDPAQPKTPYSNTPLKDMPPDEVQPKQPIPLEYRAILK